MDEELRGSQSDKLLRVRLRSGRRAYVYALLEHNIWFAPELSTAPDTMNGGLRQ